MNKFVLIGFFVCITSVSHAYNLDSVKAIECVDDDQKKDVKLYFSTTQYGAEKYARLPGSIPYSYGNLLTYTTKTGVMKLNNNPDEVDGIVWLFENDGYDLSSIKLHPTGNPNLYNGLVSGGIEDLNGDWIEVQDHKIACTVEMF